MEYFYFRSATEPSPWPGKLLSTSRRRRGVGAPPADDTLALESMGIPVQYSHHEIAPPSRRSTSGYTDALTYGPTT